MSALRAVLIRVSSVKTSDVYEARTYPDEDYDDNGRIELYQTPVYKVFLEGKDAAGKAVTKEWKALRFMPYWNDPKRPDRRYKTLGWVDSGLHHVAKKPVPRYIKDYEIHNRTSRFGGAIQVQGSFLIHGGPEDVTDWGWGAAGCVEIIGSFDDFRVDILALSGSAETDIHKGMQGLVDAGKLFVQIDLAEPPDLKASLSREVDRTW